MEGTLCSSFLSKGIRERQAKGNYKMPHFSHLQLSRVVVVVVIIFSAVVSMVAAVGTRIGENNRYDGRFFMIAQGSLAICDIVGSVWKILDGFSIPVLAGEHSIEPAGEHSIEHIILRFIYLTPEFVETWISATVVDDIRVVSATILKDEIIARGLKRDMKKRMYCYHD